MSGTPREAAEILDFWFGAPGSPERGRARDAWWRKDPAFDAQVAARFGAAVDEALGGGMSHWTAPQPALARILLLDQFTRHVFRGTARAFDGDPQALAAARDLVAQGHDRALEPFPRAFAYLPFEHAEDLAAQDEAVRLFTALRAAAPEVGDMLDFALRHREVIRRFGRFPHRNGVLGRASTAEEVAFLREPGSSF
jgi:uncharacterized protein (DUF924 family)